MEKLEYMIKWRQANKEKLKIQRRERYLREKTHRPSRRKNPDQRCAYCEIYLRYGTKTRRKYCDSCALNPKLFMVRWKTYAKRAYQRRKALIEHESI